MRVGFYFGLAKDGIRKNKRLYLPYILTCVGVVMIHYILGFLSKNPFLASVQGGNFIQYTLGMGTWVISIFSCIFLFYTNSFLIRRRKKEFGLYNILGMGRKHIGLILLFESLIVAGLALGGGLAAGILFSKLAELGLLNILKMQISMDFHISLFSVKRTILLYLGIFLILFLNTLRQIRFQSALTLLGSERAGEKPPKANWLLGIAGFLLLGIAYYAAVSIKDPVAAFTIFFFAVILVILATYLLLIAGSVVLCRVLQKNKKFYYRTQNYVSVSSMLYRMKRNGAGLATICILSTMVLVILSSTTCLYFGSEDALSNRYPSEVMVTLCEDEAGAVSDEVYGKLDELCYQLARDNGVEPKQYSTARFGYLTGVILEDQVKTQLEGNTERVLGELQNMVLVMLCPVADYEKVTGRHVELSQDEVLLYSDDIHYDYDTIRVGENTTFRVKEKLDKEDPAFGEATGLTNSSKSLSFVSQIWLFTSDFDRALGDIPQLVDDYGKKSLTYEMVCYFDTELPRKEQLSFGSRFAEQYKEQPLPASRYYIETRASQYADFYQTFGGLLYLGIMLSVVFILAAVLMIYYKQISEGYEDQARFDIMQKVGMTQTEIKRSINAQMRTVFFLPLILAGIHVVFAFPMVRKLLLLFGLNNVGLFMTTSAISFVVFGIFYMVVYKLTAVAYYRIVSNIS